MIFSPMLYTVISSHGAFFFFSAFDLDVKDDNVVDHIRFLCVSWSPTNSVSICL